MRAPVCVRECVCREADLEYRNTRKFMFDWTYCNNHGRKFCRRLRFSTFVSRASFLPRGRNTALPTPAPRPLLLFPVILLWRLYGKFIYSPVSLAIASTPLLLRQIRIIKVHHLQSYLGARDIFHFEITGERFWQ
jgi:hypothetical protein